MYQGKYSPVTTEYIIPGVEVVGTEFRELTFGRADRSKNLQKNVLT